MSVDGEQERAVGGKSAVDRRNIPGATSDSNNCRSFIRNYRLGWKSRWAGHNVSHLLYKAARTPSQTSPSVVTPESGLSPSQVAAQRPFEPEVASISDSDCPQTPIAEHRRHR